MKWLSLFLFTLPVFAQPAQRLIFVATDPSGSCVNGQALQWNAATGNLSGCVLASWTVIATGSASGPITSVTGSSPISSSGGTTPNITVATATSAALGVVKPDGTVITDTAGAITVPQASSSVFGVVKVDGTTITASGGVISSTGTVTIANGTSSLGTSAISSGTCASTVTTTATGVATTDDIIADFNADPTSTTGYKASANGMLTIIKFPTSGNVNFNVCNNTANSITPGAVTLNWRVVR